VDNYGSMANDVGSELVTTTMTTRATAAASVVSFGTKHLVNRVLAKCQL
jgi:hypothetical protein